MNCEVEDCSRVAKTRGWCSLHYGRWLTHGNPLIAKREWNAQPSTCAADDCSDKPKARGWCNIHYKRWRRTGQIEIQRSKTPAAIRSLKYYIAGSSDECWPWTGFEETTGYGRMVDDRGRLTTATRIVYEARVGPIPAGLTLDHLCRNRICVNPNHLEPVTQAVNNSRIPRVPALVCRNGHKLTEDNVVLRGRIGKRTCRKCERARCARQKSREKAERWARLGWA